VRPDGIGVLYGREVLLEAMPRGSGGGDMILAVSFERTLYNGPYKSRPALPHIAGADRPRRASSTWRSSGSSVSPPPSTRCSINATDSLQLVPMTIVGTFRAEGGRRLLHRRRRATRTTSDTIPSLEGVAIPHGPPLRHAGHGILRRARPARGLVPLLQHTRRGRLASVSALRVALGDYARLDANLRNLYRDVIIDHKPQTAELPAPCRTSGPAGRGFKPRLCGATA